MDTIFFIILKSIIYLFFIYIYIYTRIIYFVASLSMVVGIFVTSSRKRPIYEARDLKLSFSCDLISKRVKTILFFESRELNWLHRQSRGIKRKVIEQDFLSYATLSLFVESVRVLTIYASLSLSRESTSIKLIRFQTFRLWVLGSINRSCHMGSSSRPFHLLLLRSSCSRLEESWERISA